MANELTLEGMKHYVVEVRPAGHDLIGTGLSTEQNIRRLLGAPFEGAQPAVIYFSPTRQSVTEFGTAFIWEIPKEVDDLRSGRPDDTFIQKARGLLKAYVEKNSGSQTSYSFMILHALDAQGNSAGPRGISYPFEAERPSLGHRNSCSIAAPVPGIGSGT